FPLSPPPTTSRCWPPAAACALHRRSCTDPPSRSGTYSAQLRENLMTTQILHAIVGAGMAFTVATTSPLAIAHIHGTIVKIDSARGTFTIHHDPFPIMPMAMTMEVEPVRHADLRKLRVGEVIF